MESGPSLHGVGSDKFLSARPRLEYEPSRMRKNGDSSGDSSGYNKFPSLKKVATHNRTTAYRLPHGDLSSYSTVIYKGILRLIRMLYYSGSV